MDYKFCMKAKHYFYKLHPIIYNVSKHEAEAVVVVIVWQLDLQIPVQCVPITTKVMRLNLLRRSVLDSTLCDKVCQWLTTGWWFSPVSSTNNTDHHDITKVALNTINQPTNQSKSEFHVTRILNIRFNLMCLWDT